MGKMSRKVAPEVQEQDTLEATTGSRNPFINRTLMHLSCWEGFKLVVMTALLVPLLRMLAVFLCMVLVAAWGSLVTCGHRNYGPDGTFRPLPAWRRFLLHPCRWLARCMLFAMGYMWIEERGPKPSCCDTRGPGAPLIVANHVTFVDPLYFFATFTVSGVSKAALGKVPIFGKILKVSQGVLVNRTREKGKTSNTVHKIVERVENPRAVPVLIFPEGTTSNAEVMTAFKKGAFIAGAPVRPVALEYPYCFLDVSWVPGPTTMWLVWRMLCQVYNRLRVTYLPVYVPSDAEKANPDLYARNVRRAMADAVGCETSEHSFEDVHMLMSVGRYAARNLQLGEARRLRTKSYMGMANLNLNKTVGLLRLFEEADDKRSGTVGCDAFTRVWLMYYEDFFDADRRLPRRVLAHIFHLLDHDNTDAMSFEALCIAIATMLQKLASGKIMLSGADSSGASGSTIGSSNVTGAGGGDGDDGGGDGPDATEISNTRSKFAFATYDVDEDRMLSVTDITSFRSFVQMHRMTNGKPDAASSMMASKVNAGDKAIDELLAAFPAGTSPSDTGNGEAARRITLAQFRDLVAKYPASLDAMLDGIKDVHVAITSHLHQVVRKTRSAAAERGQEEERTEAQKRRDSRGQYGRRRSIF